MKSALMTLVLPLVMAVSWLCAGENTGIRSFKFGECEIICLQDVQMHVPQSLFSDVADTGHQQKAETYEASVNVFLVRKGGATVLIDAGNDSSRGSLCAKLRKLNVAPASITDIFITHIHPDHVGGLLWHGKVLFSKATIHIAREELAAWRKDSNRKELSKYLKPYGVNIRGFEYGEELPCGLVPLKRGGHTPGHTIFKMPLGHGTDAIFVGDIAHAAGLQFLHPTFCARYDAVPQDAVKSRILTLQMKGILFGAHFPFPGATLGGGILRGKPDWMFSYQKPTVDK